MNLFSFIGAGIVMCVLIVTVKQWKPELSLPLTVACGAVMSLFLITQIAPLTEEIRSFASVDGVEAQWLGIAVKCVGICIAVQTAADVCRDAGQSALAGKLELGGKAALLIVAFPLFREMLHLAVQIMGE